ncbi:hypothetical protein K7X08_028641 [Anisodus acutangulus]|uniref:Uncharacterized protein n=1 Tax=Anisodus acutangulus TaxID=402998 RepID=A0A9Q1R9C1_9SOLA|nr:hypothetical protein K7X08_028641 [Anisodus acutangulus]
MNGENQDNPSHVSNIEDLPSAIRNAPGIDLIVDLNCDKEEEQCLKEKSRKEQKMKVYDAESMTDKEKKKNKKDQDKYRRGRKEDRKFRRTHALSIDSTDSRVNKSDHHDTAQSQIKDTSIVLRGRSKSRNDNSARNKKKKEG